MEVSYEGLAGEPGFQLGTFLENHYGIEDGHVFPDDMTMLSIGTVLCRHEFTLLCTTSIALPAACPNALWIRPHFCCGWQ